MSSGQDAALFRPLLHQAISQFLINYLAVYPFIHLPIRPFVHLTTAPAQIIGMC